MKDLGDAYFVLRIQIHQDRSRDILGLSQRSYVRKVLKKFGIQDCKSGETSSVLINAPKEIWKIRK